MSYHKQWSPQQTGKGPGMLSHARKPKSSKSLRPRKVGTLSSKNALAEATCGTSKTTSQNKNSLIYPGLRMKPLSVLNGDRVKVVNLQFAFPCSFTNTSTIRSEENSSIDDKPMHKTPKVSSNRCNVQSLLTTVNQTKRHERKHQGGTIMRRPKVWSRKTKDTPFNEPDVQGSLPKLAVAACDGPEVKVTPIKCTESKEILPSDYLATMDYDQQQSIISTSQPPMRSSCFQNQRLQVQTPLEIRLRKLSKVTAFGASVRQSTSTNSSTIPGSLLPAGKIGGSLPPNPLPMAMNERKEICEAFKKARRSNDTQSLFVLPPINRSSETLQKNHTKHSSASNTPQVDYHRVFNQNRFTFKLKQDEGLVKTPKVVQIDSSALIDKIRENQNQNGRRSKIHQHSLLSRNPSAAGSVHSAKSSPAKQGGGGGNRHIVEVEREANQSISSQIHQAINTNSPNSGIRVRALKSFYNSVKKQSPKQNTLLYEENGRSGRYISPKRAYLDDDLISHSDSPPNEKRVHSRVPSSFFRSSPYSPCKPAAQQQMTDVSLDSTNYIAATYNIVSAREEKREIAKYIENKNQLSQFGQSQQRKTTEPLTVNLEDISKAQPVNLQYSQRIEEKTKRLAAEDGQSYQEEIAKEQEQKQEEQETKQEEESSSDSDEEEEFVEKMFIGEEFDTEDDAHTTTHANNSSMTKLRQERDDRQEIESIILIPTEGVKIPQIQTEELTESPTHQKDSQLKITIPVPMIKQAQEEEQEKEEKEVEKQQRLDTPTADKPKPRKTRPCMSILSVTPLNLQEHFQKFQASGFKENPQFQYQYPGLAAKFLSQFKKPRTELLPMAQNILDNFLKDYGSESNYLENHCGRILTKEQAEEHFVKYIEELGLQNQLSLYFSDNAVAPTSVVHDGKSQKSRICISLPIQYREKRMTGVMHHEIGTHFLRKYNDKYQIWWGKRRNYEMKPCIATEEGLASINQLYEHALKGDPKPYLYKGALNYYACCKAAEMSFVELFEELGKYVDDPYRRWKYCLRVKRGMTDTSQPGGMYKDQVSLQLKQVYLQGSVKILRNRKQLDFMGLHCGKMTVDDSLRPFIKK